MSTNYQRLRALRAAEYLADAASARCAMRSHALRHRIAVAESDEKTAIQAKGLAVFYRDHAREYAQMADNIRKEVA